MTNPLRRKLLRPLAAVTCACLLLCSPAVAAAAPDHGRGTVLSADPVQRLDFADVPAAIDYFDPGTVRYGVDAYRVTYRTVDVRGRRTTASGLVVVPRGGSGRFAVWEHGTRSSRREVGSNEPATLDRKAALLLGASGYVTVAPDYLGLGDGPGFHPYMDSATEVSASVDLMHAARDLVHAKGNSRVMVTGFSQGGQAAMALAKELQGGVPHFELAAVAPISGPYDVRGAELPGVFNGEVAPDVAVFYLSYWTVSMNRLFPLYRKASEVFRAPYDQYAESLFDGSHSEPEIFPKLAPTPQEMFTDAYLARMRHPSGALLAATRASDGTCSWRPRVPVLLFASPADTQVTITNSRHCQAELRAHGVDAPLVELPGVEHLDTPIPALPQIIRWFSGLGGAPRSAS